MDFTPVSVRFFPIVTCGLMEVTADTADKRSRASPAMAMARSVFARRVMVVLAGQPLYRRPPPPPPARDHTRLGLDNGSITQKKVIFDRKIAKFETFREKALRRLVGPEVSQGHPALGCGAPLARSILPLLPPPLWHSSRWCDGAVHAYRVLPSPPPSAQAKQGCDVLTLCVTLPPSSTLSNGENHERRRG